MVSEGGNGRPVSWVGWAVAWGSLLIGLVAVVVAANVYGEKTALQTQVRTCQTDYAHVLKEQGKAEASPAR